MIRELSLSKVSKISGCLAVDETDSTAECFFRLQVTNGLFFEGGYVMRKTTILALAGLLCLLIGLIGCKKEDEATEETPAAVQEPASSEVLPPAAEQSPPPAAADQSALPPAADRSAPPPATMEARPSAPQRKRPFTSTTGPRREGETPPDR